MRNIRYIFFFLITSCTVASEIVNDEISVLNFNIKIVQDKGKCYLVNTQGRYELSPKPPCHFLRNSNNSPQYYSYVKNGIDATLIISGTPISNTVRKQWGIPPGLVCGFESQGVLIRKGGIMPTTKTLEGGVLCKDNGSDEKNYWYFAH
jgi:hypothetical protein